MKINNSILQDMTEEERYDVKVRIDRKIERDPDTGCHVWIGAQSPRGYGVMSVGRGTQRAHRVAYEIANGPIPAGKVIRHTCHNPSCVNPNHLLPGTPAENTEDMLVAERRPKKLSDADVAVVFGLAMLREKYKDIAAKFGVGQPIISMILRGQRQQGALDRELDRALAEEAA